MTDQTESYKNFKIAMEECRKKHNRKRHYDLAEYYKKQTNPNPIGKALQTLWTLCVAGYCLYMTYETIIFLMEYFK